MHHSGFDYFRLIKIGAVSSRFRNPFWFIFSTFIPFSSWFSLSWLDCSFNLILGSLLMSPFVPGLFPSFDLSALFYIPFNSINSSEESGISFDDNLILGLNDPLLRFFGLIVSFPTNNCYWSEGMFFKDEFNPPPFTIIDPFLESLRRLWTGV